MNETIRSNRIPEFRCRRLASFSRYCRRGFLRMRAPKRYKAHTVRPLPAGLRIKMSRKQRDTGTHFWTSSARSAPSLRRRSHAVAAWYVRRRLQTVRAKQWAAVGAIVQEAHLALVRLYEASQNYEKVLSHVALARRLTLVAVDDKLALAEFLFNTALRLIKEKSFQMASRVARQTVELYREFSISNPDSTQDLSDALRLSLTSLTESGDYVGALEVRLCG